MCFDRPSVPAIDKVGEARGGGDLFGVTVLQHQGLRDQYVQEIHWIRSHVVRQLPDAFGDRCSVGRVIHWSTKLKKYEKQAIQHYRRRYGPGARHRGVKTGRQADLLRSHRPLAGKRF